MIVVKFGGHAMKDENGLFASAIKQAKARGEQVVVVHGGGPQIDAALAEAGIVSEFKGGFRITTPQIYSVVEEVLAKRVGPSLAEQLRSHGVDAIALSGRGDGILYAEKLAALVDGSPVDLGYVGKVSHVEATPLHQQLDMGKVVVLSPVAQSLDESHGFNVNADLAAAAVAGALGATSLVVMTDVAGIYRAWPDKSSLITQISASELAAIKSTFESGMAPKVQACLDAIAQGAKAVRIIDGTDPTSFQKALDNSGGTLVNA